tara:strand:+ start:373 stop:651 length:279 start_codon:yes stop_codon:yes gene_type:complete
MILVKFKILVDSGVSYYEYSCFEDFKVDDYFYSYNDETLLEWCYGKPDGGFGEAMQSSGEYEYDEDRIIRVSYVKHINDDELNILRKFNFVI